jgi:TRAP-type C4-dicarboxylate transport system permease small subunit
MNSLVSRLKTFIRYETGLMQIIAGISLILLMLIISVDVFGRVFEHPVGSAHEMSMIFMGVLILLGMANTTQRNIHTKVEMFFNKFPPMMQAVISCINHAVMMILWLLMAYQNVVAGFAYMSRGQETEYLKVPIYPFYFLVALGTFACFLESSLHFSSWLTRMKGGKP